MVSSCWNLLVVLSPPSLQSAGHPASNIRLPSPPPSSHSYQYSMHATANIVTYHYGSSWKKIGTSINWHMMWSIEFCFVLYGDAHHYKILRIKISLHWSLIYQSMMPMMFDTKHIYYNASNHVSVAAFFFDDRRLTWWISTISRKAKFSGTRPLINLRKK